MNEIDQIRLLADLAEEKCGLNHGSWNCEDDRAVDVLVIPIGYHESKDVDITVRELTIYTCRECSATLSSKDKNWICFVCTSCGSSAWKIRTLLKQKYTANILQPVKYCPRCYEDKNENDKS